MKLTIAAWLPRACVEFRNVFLETADFEQLLGLASQEQSISPSTLHAHSFGRAALHVWSPRNQSKPSEEELVMFV
jgi:hypothetical protein